MADAKIEPDAYALEIDADGTVREYSPAAGWMAIGTVKVSVGEQWYAYHGMGSPADPPHGLGNYKSQLRAALAIAVAAEDETIGVTQ